MYKQYKNVSAIALSMALLASCSKDVRQADGPAGMNLSDGTTSISYDKGALAKQMNSLNQAISFVRPAASQSGLKATAMAKKAIADYQPSATGPTIEGNQTVTLDSNNPIYVVAKGKTFSGTINFNYGQGKIIVLGTFTGNVNLQGNGLLEVGPGATFAPNSFNVNDAACTINNYGAIELKTGSIQGEWNNYNQVTFLGHENLNSGGKFNNYCMLVFAGTNSINSSISNYSHLQFQNGISMNSSASIINMDQSYMEVTGGRIDINGKIQGGTNAFARLDFKNITRGNLNGANLFTDLLDVNFTGVSQADQDAIAAKFKANEVTKNQNVYIPANGCTPALGASVCLDEKLTLTLVGKLNSPKIENVSLSATDVRIEEDMAYISYHTNDSLYGDLPYGAINIVDLKDHTAPVLLNQATFKTVEFNGIEVSTDKLFATGQAKSGAKLVNAPIQAGAMAVTDLSQVSQRSLPGTSAKNSVLLNDKLWVVSSGNQGGLLGLNVLNAYEVLDQIAINGRAKYAAKNDLYQAFFAVESEQAYLRIAKLDGSASVEKRYPNLKQVTMEGKNTMALDKEYAYLALSDRGVAKIRLSDGAEMNTFVPKDYRVNGSKLFKAGGLTNAVAVDDCYVYLANGNDGVIVLNKYSFNVVGSFKLAESSNFVVAKNSILFVATGRDGLNIIKIN